MFEPVYIVAVAAAIAVGTLIVVLFSWMSSAQKTAAEDRLEMLTGQKRAGESTGLVREELVREGFDGLSSMFGSLTSTFGDIGLKFEQADSPLSPKAVLALSAGCAAAGVVLGMIGHAPGPLLPLIGLSTSTFPFLWLWWRRRGRFKAFAKQLPDALELVGRALRSGHSLASGLHVVVEEMPAPVCEEFGRAYEEQNLGVPLELALKNMLKRMPNMDLKFFATAVAIQRQAGGDLAEILDKISYIIRERFKIMGQVQALTGEGRISGIVLMAMPIALFFAVYYINPGYVMVLFDTDSGRMMMAGAAVLQVLGAICIKKIVNIKI